MSKYKIRKSENIKLQETKTDEVSSKVTFQNSKGKEAKVNT